MINRPTIDTGIGGGVRFRNARRPDLVGECEIFTELEDGEVHVGSVGVVVHVLVDRLGGHPPLTVHILDRVLRMLI